MTRQSLHKTEEQLETAVLVGVHAQTDDEFNFTSTMEELASLSETCQLDVQAQFTQNKQISIINTMLVKVN